MIDPVEQQTYWEQPGKRKHPSDPVIAAFARPKLDFIKHKITLPTPPKLLDVGCGNGYFTYYLQEWGAVVGLDYAAAMLRLNPIPLRIQASAFDLPFCDQTFDLVFEANTLHHLPHPVDAVKEMRRVARRYVVLIEPNRNNPLMLGLGLLKPEERASLRFTQSYITEIVRQAGLSLVVSITTGFVTPNRMPRWLAMKVAGLNFAHPLGAYSVLIAERV